MTDKITSITLDETEYELEQFSDGVKKMVATVSELKDEQIALKAEVEAYLTKAELANAKIEALAFMLNQKLIETVRSELDSKVAEAEVRLASDET